ncbi:MAG: HD domain-containing protein [Nitrospirota bacterium]
MTRIDDLHYMPEFVKNKGKVIYPSEESYGNVISEWATLLQRQYRKGLIPLFITGSGVSVPVVPTIFDIVKKLRELYNKKKNKESLVTLNKDIEELFKMLHDLSERGKKDRSIIARLLNSFQENSVLKDEWQQLNKWLFDEILKASPTAFHQGLADIYEELNAVCLTLNFDGLLIREFVQYRSIVEHRKRAFSLPTVEECEQFFLRTYNHGEKESEREFLEVQIRGDILYIECNAAGYCPQKGTGKERSIWASIGSFSDKPDEGKTEIIGQKLLQCPSCGEPGISFLSFPGSYKKEKDMQNMLSIIWRFLAFRAGSVTVVGMSGEWDPLIVAFLGDLLSEREIPLLVVDNKPEATEQKEYPYIIRELVKPDTHYAAAVGVDANSFMRVLKEKLSACCLPTCDYKIEFNRQATDDSYWYQKVQSIDISGVADEEKAKLEYIRKSINQEFSYLEDNLIIDKLKLSEQLNRFAQLGLKSYWLGTKADPAKYHNRYNHSIGVMKIASYLYDRAIANSGRKENLCEKQFLRLAALLHDVGHLPFSHLIESVFKELNWKPAGYMESYSHVLQTNDKILEFFETEDLKKKLESLNYTVKDLINLVNGCFGVGYLDALINSSVDADKIDYVFRDTDSTGRRISLSPIQFLKDITNGLTITPESYFAFSGVSAIAAQQLLETRQHLYQNLYLQPGILILEGIVKLIIKTYFVHFLNLKNDKLLGDITYDQKDYPDLGDYKIRYSIKSLNDLLTEATLSNNDNFELAIVNLMFTKIKACETILNTSFYEGLENGFKKLNHINNEDRLKALEDNMLYKKLKGQRKVIAEIIRDVEFRMPGAAIIELRKLPEYLSAADKRKEIDRSDGTKTFAECILVPDGSPDSWTPTSKAAKAISDSSFGISSPEEHAVYLYPLSGNLDNSYFRQTLNLFDKMLNKKGVASFSNV